MAFTGSQLWLEVREISRRSRGWRADAGRARGVSVRVYRSLDVGEVSGEDGHLVLGGVPLFLDAVVPVVHENDVSIDLHREKIDSIEKVHESKCL